MTAQTTIPILDQSILDYPTLRKKALAYIEELAGATWTDYNTHDPGITLLETLIYVLTDLSYRTNLSIEDLLASNPVEGFDPSLFQAEAILPAHPLTLEDVEKQLLDTAGVQNVWVYKRARGKIEIYFNESTNSLQETTPNPDPGEEVLLSGLYEVEVESEQTENSATVIATLENVLNRDRNLCEDSISVNPIQTKNVRIYATIIFSLETDVVSSLAKIFFRVHQFLNPRINFDSLETLQKEAIPTEELFEGPLLNKGFLRKNNVEAIRKGNILYFSDVLAAMWDSGNEQAILSIDKHPDHPSLVNLEDESQNHVGYLSLGEHTQSVLDVEHSVIRVLFETKKGQLEEVYDVAMHEVKEALDDLIFDETSRPDPIRTRLEIPKGTQKTIKEYASAQEELPSVYAVGKHVLPKSGTNPERLAQSKQLQGFLLLFDQLMGNYLAQLSQVGSLFSYAPQEQTYFSQVLTEVTGIRELLHEYNGTTEGDWNQFITTFSERLQGITEPTNSGFMQRRHQFLDHLLARFSEVYTDVQAFQDMGQVQGDEGITAKEYLLNSYDQLSKQRGKGFNYREENLWGPSSKVSGYEQWVRAKLGISDMTRDSLCSSKSLFDRLLFGQNQDSSDAISINFNSYTNLTSWTLELWVLPSQNSNSSTLIDLQNTSSENLLQVTIEPNAELLITLASETPVEISDAAIQWNQWMQLAVSYDQNTATATIFINGNQIQEITFSGTLPTFANSTVVLGSNVDRNAVLKGAIAKFLLWDKALSESEIIENTRDTSLENNVHLMGLWKAEINGFQNLKDSATNHGMIQGSPLYLQQASFAGVNLLLQQFRENTNDTVSINFDSYNALTSWTLELWVLPSQNSNSSTLIDIQKNTNSENILCLEINNSADLLVKLATESQVTISNAAIQWDQWVHLAVSYDHDNIISTIFVDGNQVKQVNLSESIPSFETATTYLGNNKGNTAAFKGAIARLALWGKEFSQSDLTNKEQILNGDEVDLEGLWKTLQYFRDQKAYSNNHGTIEGTPEYQEVDTNGMGTFHVIEHLLLRPKNAYSLNFLTPLSQFDNDPYSNQLSVICPEWMAPFSSQGYRNHFTHMLQTETPAHLYINILWISDPSQLWQFELHYREWLEAQYIYFTFNENSKNYRTAHKNFIDTFNTI